MNLRHSWCLIAVLVLVAGSQPGRSAPPTARELYTAAVTREQALRASADKQSPALQDYRAVINAYDAVVRRFPTSGYVDNALWQGAAVATEAFQRFGEERDRTTAQRMLRLLIDGYPVSPFVPKAREALQQMAERVAAPEKKPPPLAAQPTPRKIVALRAITRTVMPDRVRVTLDLDGQTTYRTERVEGPPRVLIDLVDTRPGPGVPEGTLTYQDEVASRVRIGVHPKQVTRVVVSLDGIVRCTVSTPERPNRIVIDCERAGAPSPLPARVIPPSWGALPTVSAVDTQLLRPPPPAEPARTSTVPRTPAAEPDASPPPLPSPAAAAPAPAPSAPAPNIAPAGRPPYSLARQLGLGASKIIIDPGHGGHDPGALGIGISEAEVVLDVALRLEKLLREAGVDVVLTRRTDEFVPLEERPAIATREQADLFLSIHANASRTRAARGIESYFLNFSTEPAAEEVAARENAATERTINNLPEILKAIALNSKLDESRSFAALIQRAMATELNGANGGLRDHGVKQAPFVVLIGAAMPSVLVEIAFITNPQEGRLLKSGAYRQKIAQALFDGVRGYQKSLKGASAVSRH